MMTSLSC